MPQSIRWETRNQVEHMATLLIIEDDQAINGLMARTLSITGHQCLTAYTGSEAISMIKEQAVDLALLDINLPGTTGFELCQELRKVSNVPVIFASARTSETDRITGFDIGGDDYLPKPYSMKELLSRVNALIRRAYGFSEEEKIVIFGDVSVDITARTVTKNGKPISLSLREFDLLSYLCKHKNTAVAKEKILNDVWGAFSLVEPSTLTVHIRWLREKLEDNPAKPAYIRTVYKVGYMLEDGE